GPEVGQQALRCHLRTVDTIRDTHPVVGISGQGQAWETLHQGLDTCYAVEVADMVLRHGLLVSGDAHAERLTADPQELPQVLVHRPWRPRIAEGELFRLQSAADKGPQQNLILRRPSREFDAAEGTGYIGPLFDRRYDKTHAVQGMGDIGTLTGDVDNGRRGILNVLEGCGQGGLDVREQLACLRCPQNQTHSFTFQSRLLEQVHDPAGSAWDRLETTYRRVQTHRMGWEVRCDGVDQRLHALAERHEQPITRATRTRGRCCGAALPGQHGTDQAAMSLLHLDKLRHRCLRAQILGIGCIDPPDHGLRHAFQGLLPETARHELRQRFVPSGSATRHHQIECHTRLATPAKHWRGHERPPRAGDHQVKPLWYGHKP